MFNDINGGRYTGDEIERILEINDRPNELKRPTEAFYKKAGREHGPNWAEKREFVHWLINDSNITPTSKNYLRDNDFWISKYQLRGFKYGLATSTLTFFFFPVIKNQTFLRRFTIAMIPMAYFMRWGHIWGHENWWRRQKEVIVTYEIYAGTRSKFTMK